MGARFIEANKVPDIVKRYLANSSDVKLAVAFLTLPGLDSLHPELKKFLIKGHLQVVVGMSREHGITEPSAVRYLARSQSADVRFFDDPAFHPKMVLFKKGHRTTAGIIGSSNLTGPGVGMPAATNVEANVLLEDGQESNCELALADAEEYFDYLFSHAKIASDNDIALYERNRRRPKKVDRRHGRIAKQASPVPSDLSPETVGILSDLVTSTQSDRRRQWRKLLEHLSRRMDVTSMFQEAAESAQELTGLGLDMLPNRGFPENRVGSDSDCSHLQRVFKNEGWNDAVICAWYSFTHAGPKGKRVSLIVSAEFKGKWLGDIKKNLYHSRVLVKYLKENVDEIWLYSNKPGVGVLYDLDNEELSSVGAGKKLVGLWSKIQNSARRPRSGHPEKRVGRVIFMKQHIDDWVEQAKNNDLSIKRQMTKIIGNDLASLSRIYGLLVSQTHTRNA